MIVELFGHAGAGKTTLAAGLFEQVRRLEVPVTLVEGRALMGRNLMRRRVLQMYSLFRSPRVAVDGMRLLGLSDAEGLRAIGTLGGLICRRWHIQGYSTDGGIVIVDEGVLHGIWSLVATCQRPQQPALKAFIERVAIAGWGISVRPARSNVLDKLHRKDRHRLNTLQPTEVGDALDRLESVLDACEAFLCERGTLIRTESIDSKAVEEIALRLVAAWRR